MSKFALVSTVDSMGREFPSHCVLLFETERDAYSFAAKCIVKYDESVEYIEEEMQWIIGDEHYDLPCDFVEAWQFNLDNSEYFHVKPVEDVKQFVD